MRVRLTRLSNFGNALRTDSVDGELFVPLAVGNRIVIDAPPLEVGDVRRVVTTPVVRIEDAPGGTDVWTENTHYRLEFLDEGPPEEVEKYYWADKRWREEQGK